MSGKGRTPDEVLDAAMLAVNDLHPKVMTWERMMRQASKEKRERNQERFDGLGGRAGGLCDQERSRGKFIGVWGLKRGETRW